MDVAKMLGDAYDYTRRGLWGKWGKWILLAIGTIIFPFILGYMFWIFRGVKPAPELTDGVKLFIDGIKLFVLGLIYFMPVYIVSILFFGGAYAPFVSALATGNIREFADALLNALTGLAVGFILVQILQIVIFIVLIIAAVRYARTNNIAEAFNFTAIFEQINRIGWGAYIVALIVLWIIAVVFSAVAAALGLIPVLGWIIVFFLYPAYLIFIARYVTLVYDSAGSDLT
ncbi:DUF4013 domain-containing protein [Methanoculleus sp. FWC-SCC1]|uniref:DUF4013 domain-containing protein n=1 Tax=Methanoculleus frigidifontis TaxID=2584085 RepID=A0ABT8MD65_9EURY|nr:DUF4013 domain-containing protein [Methanoculleus sp. FWC-SCC1]MDN7025829.1 DUF4013 domain-containing protein [Methanoculleus sp. FWC-SCC1]